MSTRRQMWNGARAAWMLVAPLALSACGEVIPPPTTASFTPASPRPSTQQPAAPALQANGVIGADARALIRQFGEPRLDIRDPAARKLQFGDGRCILDAYLYPARDRREPVVTYAEARRPDGTAMDWVTCANQLKGH